MSKELPSVEELKASQAKGATGKGTARQNYGEMQADFNMGCGGEDYPENFDPSVDH